MCVRTQPKQLSGGSQEVSDVLVTTAKSSFPVFWENQNEVMQNNAITTHVLKSRPPASQGPAGLCAVKPEHSSLGRVPGIAASCGPSVQGRTVPFGFRNESRQAQIGHQGGSPRTEITLETTHTGDKCASSVCVCTLVCTL